MKTLPLLSILIKTARQTIETVMAFLTTKNSIYLTLLIFIGCISPFVHIFYGVRDTEGIFGYKYMSSFLNAFGRINALLCAALFIKFTVSKITNEYKKIINIGANMFLYVASFFLINLFLPKKVLFGTVDFPPYFYWLSMFILSITSGIFLSTLQKAFLTTEENLKSIIRKLFRYIYESEADLKTETIEKHKLLRGELIKKTLDNVR